MADAETMGPEIQAIIEGAMSRKPGQPMRPAPTKRRPRPGAPPAPAAGASKESQSERETHPEGNTGQDGEQKRGLSPKDSATNAFGMTLEDLDRHFAGRAQRVERLVADLLSRHPRPHGPTLILIAERTASAYARLTELDNWIDAAILDERVEMIRIYTLLREREDAVAQRGLVSLEMLRERELRVRVARAAPARPAQPSSARPDAEEARKATTRQGLQ